MGQHIEIAVTEHKDTIQFTGYVNNIPVVMSIPEPDDGEEYCEFPGYQTVYDCVQAMVS